MIHEGFRVMETHTLDSKDVHELEYLTEMQTQCLRISSIQQ